jgi:hypothetical protein
MKEVSFQDFVVQIGECIRRARQVQELPTAEVQRIDEQIQKAFEVIDMRFRDDFDAFLEKKGVSARLRTISLSVVGALRDIDGYSVEPEVGSLSIYKGRFAETQPLTPLASAATLYFHVPTTDPDYDFILACLSRREFYEVVQLHHYFRNHPSRSEYRFQAAGGDPATLPKAKKKRAG